MYMGHWLFSLKDIYIVMDTLLLIAMALQITMVIYNVIYFFGEVSNMKTSYFFPESDNL